MPTYRQYLNDSPGMALQDVWNYQPHSKGLLWGTEDCIDQDVRWLQKQGDPERLGYPTQKPRGLLRRIIESSTEEGDVVLDPFCGCGTTVHTAQMLRRQWIGIDITIHAIALIEDVLRQSFGADVNFVTRGVPTSIEEAQALSDRNKFQFQAWAVYRLGGAPEVEAKKGADQGVDGRLYFRLKDKDPFQQIVISVKGGKLKATDVRDLRGTMTREKADIGVLACLHEPSRQMRAEAASAGVIETPWGKFPRLQLVTVAQMLAGGRLDLPPVTGSNVTLKAAPKVLPIEPAKIELDLSTLPAMVAEEREEPYPKATKSRKRPNA